MVLHGPVTNSTRTGTEPRPGDCWPLPYKSGEQWLKFSPETTAFWEKLKFF